MWLWATLGGELREPGPQPGGSAAVANPRIVGAEGAVTFQHGPEGRPGLDFAEVDGQAQLREPVGEPDPEGAVSGRITVGHVVIRADEELGCSEGFNCAS